MSVTRETSNPVKRSHSVCYSIGDFCKSFSRMPKVLNATFDGTNAGQVRSCFAAYMDLVREQVSSREKAEEVLDGVMKRLEDHITRTMHGDVVATWASAADLELWRKAQQLQGWKECEFGLCECEMEPAIMTQAGCLLDQLPELMTPHEKLSLISDFSSLVLTDLRLCHALSQDSNPEACLRALAFTVVRYLGTKEKPQQLHSSLAFVYTFGTYRQPTLRATFSFSLFQGALTYIDRL